MTEPTRAADTPMFTEVVQGKSYVWCACGLSKSQPFCDGSHSRTDITPVKYTAAKTGTIAFESQIMATGTADVMTTQ